MYSIQDKAKEVVRLFNAGNRAVIIYGVTGSEKRRLALHTASRLLEVEPKTLSKYKYEPIGITNDNGCWEFIKMHPGYCYANFIGTEQQKDGGSKGIFSVLCRKARELRDLHSRKECTRKFVLVIEDIDAVDIADLFGEMLVGLQFSNMSLTSPTMRNLSIPDNMYIIATCSHDGIDGPGLDSSVAKHFTFYHVDPQVEELTDMLARRHSRGSRLSEDSIMKYAVKCISLNEALRKTADEQCLWQNCQLGQRYYALIRNYITSEDTEITPEHLQIMWDAYLAQHIIKNLSPTMPRTELKLFLERERRHFVND